MTTVGGDELAACCEKSFLMHAHQNNGSNAGFLALA